MAMAFRFRLKEYEAYENFSRFDNTLDSRTTIELMNTTRILWDKVIEKIRHQKEISIYYYDDDGNKREHVTLVRPRKIVIQRVFTQHLALEYWFPTIRESPTDFGELNKKLSDISLEEASMILLQIKRLHVGSRVLRTHVVLNEVTRGIFSKPDILGIPLVTLSFAINFSFLRFLSDPQNVELVPPSWRDGVKRSYQMMKQMLTKHFLDIYSIVEEVLEEGITLRQYILNLLAQRGMLNFRSQIPLDIVAYLEDHGYKLSDFFEEIRKMEKEGLLRVEYSQTPRGELIPVKVVRK